MKQRCATPHKLVSYNSLNYFAYVVYPPLYIAGPIMTFNDFYWQVNVGRWLPRVCLELIFLFFGSTEDPFTLNVVTQYRTSSGSYSAC